jgi:hypothetical protein
MDSSLLIRLWAAYAQDADGDYEMSDEICTDTKLFEK